MTGVATLPTGPVRFFALDVETANHDRASICQIGIACVRPDNRIDTWASYVDPGTRNWSCSFVHGITGATVQGAPGFAEVFARIDTLLAGHTVYQHSHFDRGAVNAACGVHGLIAPSWQWQDSVKVARKAWPQLKGNGGHGLASLKTFLGLEFRHHDAGEDARAAAQVVLRAEADAGVEAPRPRAPVMHGATGPDMVPVGDDGTAFHPGLARDGVFTIGAQGAEIRCPGFQQALSILRAMDPPCWRRPTSGGDWDIVTARGWIRPD